MPKRKRGGGGGRGRGGGRNGSDRRRVVPVLGRQSLSEEYIRIDGAYLEGGGQIIRNCMALSSILGRPIDIVDIRKGRSKPGLKSQHLEGVRLVQLLHRGTLRGDKKDSCEIQFEPGVFRHPNAALSEDAPDRAAASECVSEGATPHVTVDTGTAGSVCLLVQIIHPPLVFAPVPLTLSLKGGTNTSFAPQIDYMMEVYAPLVKRLLGISMDITVQKRGFYPRGGGEVLVTTQPQRRLESFELVNRGRVEKLNITIGCGPDKDVEWAIELAKTIVGDADEGVEWSQNLIRCSDRHRSELWCIITAHTDSGCILASAHLKTREMTAEQAVRASAESIASQLRTGICVDEHMQDQLIVWMALAHGTSRIRTCALSLHTQTAIHYASMLTSATFTVHDQDGGVFVVECDGIGFTNKYMQ